MNVIRLLINKGASITCVDKVSNVTTIYHTLFYCTMSLTLMLLVDTHVHVLNTCMISYPKYCRTCTAPKIDKDVDYIPRFQNTAFRQILSRQQLTIKRLFTKKTKTYVFLQSYHTFNC